MIREPAVAGQFYSENKQELEKQLKQFLDKAEGRHDSVAVVAPHAGYIYSGETAGHAFKALKKAEIFVIFSPNHTGLGEPVSVFPEGKWLTPLGEVEIDQELSARICKELGIQADETAHIGEHSIEVQLPFLQYLYGNDFKIVAITLAEHDLSELQRIAEAVAKSCAGKNTAFIASSDFTHFLPLISAQEKDLKAIEFIEKLDFKGFHSLVEKEQLSICGYSAITILMVLAKKLGLTQAKLLKYDTSASASGDKSSVVGYAAIKLE